MTKIVQINSCKECPNFAKGFGFYFCENNIDKTIEDSMLKKAIPDWCSLMDITQLIDDYHD